MNKLLLHTLIEQQAGQHADLPAVIEQNGKTLSYRELQQYSNQIAHFLQTGGVTAGQVVALNFDPCCAYIVCLMAVLKANAVAMPIDARMPQRRIASMYDLAEPVLTLTDKPIEAEGKVVHISNNHKGWNPTFDSFSPELPEITIQGDSPAYIMFTSGSTGKPKGILGKHKSLSHFIHWEKGEFVQDVTPRVSQFAPLSFDVSLRDIFFPLFCGGSLCIPEAETRTNPDKLLEWIRTSKLTHIHIVPSLLRTLINSALDGDKIEPFPDLRFVLSAGEPLFGRDVKNSRKVFGASCEVVNLYGPSETTLAKAFFRTKGAALQDQQMVPIGKPISNTALLVLKGKRLCAIGEIGEIHIKTPFMSAGYLHISNEESGCFIQNPLQKEQVDIIYRTGDLGRYLEDRSISLVGRLDRQIKLNGVRVELEEIEFHLRKHPALTQLVIVPHMQDGLPDSLITYYASKEKIAGSELREYLQNMLPASMIPHHWIHLESMPLNLNGKVDVKRLPAPEALLNKAETLIAPRNEGEERIAEIWKQVLRLDAIGVTHSFLELGGDSLKAIQTVAKLSKELNTSITLKDFFAAQTIENIARLVTDSDQNGEMPIERLPKTGAYPLSPAQKRLWVLEELNPGSIAYNMPFAFWISGDFNLDAYASAWDQLLLRHEALRTSFELADDQARQIIHEELQLQLEVIDLLDSPLADYSIDDILKEYISSTTFDLKKAPLIRSLVFKVDEERYIVLVLMHHIIADGWSLDVLSTEILELYRCEVESVEPTLPELSFQYKDYADWYQKALDSGKFASARDFWLEKLDGDIPILDLPTDFRRPALQTFNGDTYKFSLSARQLTEMRQIGNKYDASLFMVLLASIKALLMRMCGQNDIIVGTPVAGRTRSDLSHQVGLYMNMIALRDTVDADLSFAGLVQRVKNTALQAFEHQMYPFDLLVEQLTIPRDVSRSPVYDVMLSLFTSGETSLSFVGAEVHQLPLQELVCRNDLSFLCVELESGELEVGLNFNTDLFKPETIKSIADLFVHFSQALLNAPDTALDTLPLTTKTLPAEGFHLPQETLCGLIHNRVIQHPEDSALRDEEHTYSYSQMWAKVEGVSEYLRTKLQINPGDVVALSHERSAETIVLLLGIMQSGAIYLPIDKDLPEARKLFMLSDSGARVLISTEDITCEAKIESPNEILSFVPPYWTVSPKLSAEDTAYLIYTSGSTGRPKGVPIAHANIVNTITAQISGWDITETDNVVQCASYSFDASISEVFIALCSGATLITPRKSTLLHIEKMKAFMLEQQITVATFTPTYLALFEQAPLPSMRVLISAGEQAHIHDLVHYAQSMRVINAFGPTECAICVSYYELPQDFDRATIPVGKAIQNTQLIVLDNNNNIVPPGIRGELAVMGAGVSSGYWNEQELTEKKFIKTEQSQMTLYKTGDIGIELPDGNFEFCGRTDSQVKIRGQRVDMEEIRHTLLSHEKVRHAHVLSHAENGQQEIAAFFVENSTITLWPSVAEFYVYDDILYGAMASHVERNSCYLRAFKKVLSGKTVVEIGPGPELILSRLCLEAGAEKIYAIELLESTYHKAQKTIEKLNLQDKITLLHGDACVMELPEKVDYCVSEIVGSIGGSEGAAHIINQSRRFLKDSSCMLPARSVTHIAAVDLKETELTYGFTPRAARYVDEIFASQGGAFDLRICLQDFPTESIVSTSDIFEDLCYTSHINLEETHTIRLNFTRESTCTGFVVWLQLMIDEEESIDILESSSSWLPVYIPLSLEGQQVQAGDFFEGRITRSLCDNGFNPDFAIEGMVFLNASNERIPVSLRSDHRSAEFKANEFYSAIFEGSAPRIIEPLKSQELYELCKNNLPGHYVPASIHSIPTLPRTVQGKIDERALLAESKKLSNEPAAETTQLSALENLIAGLWCEVLGTESAGVREDFFHTGGDSIKAIKLASMLRAHGYNMELKQLFTNPTIAQLANCIEPLNQKTKEIDSESFPLSPIQEWAFERLHEQLPGFVQSAQLKTTQNVDVAIAQQALNDVFGHHSTLQLAFEEKEGTWVQAYRGSFFNCEIEEIEQGEHFNTREWINVYVDSASFNLNEQQALLKVFLFRCHDGFTRLAFVIHHLIVDTVSWDFFLSDFQSAYNSRLQGQQAQLPPTSDSYKHYTLELRRKLEDGEFDDELPFWQAQLAQCSEYVPAEASFSFTGSIEIDLISQIQEHCQRLRFAVDKTILAVVSKAFYSLETGKPCSIELESMGRFCPDLTYNVLRTMGWFTCTYPLLLERNSGDSFVEQLRYVQGQVESIPNRGLGFTALRKKIEETAPASFRQIKPLIGYNFLGELSLGSDHQQQIWTLDKDALENDMIPALHHEIEIQLAMFRGELLYGIAMDQSKYSRADLDRFIFQIRLGFEQLARTLKQMQIDGEMQTERAEINYNDSLRQEKWT